MDRSKEASASALAANKELVEIRGKLLQLQHKDGKAAQAGNRADAAGMLAVFRFKSCFRS
jgi:hypothetical protein